MQRAAGQEAQRRYPDLTVHPALGPYNVFDEGHCSCIRLSIHPSIHFHLTSVEQKLKVLSFLGHLDQFYYLDWGSMMLEPVRLSQLNIPTLRKSTDSLVYTKVLFVLP